MYFCVAHPVITEIKKNNNEIHANVSSFPRRKFDINTTESQLESNNLNFDKKLEIVLEGDLILDTKFFHF